MQRIVHLIPLGWDFDRAVLPVQAMRAHRVYLLCDPKGYALREHYLKRVSRALNDLNVECLHVKVDSYEDLDGTMRAASKLIQSETRAGNRVLVNVATSGKLAAIAVALAAMAHLPPGAGELYYVKAKRYPTSYRGQRLHGIAAGMVGDPVALPLFPIALPDKICSFVITLLAASPHTELSYSVIMERLRVEGFGGFALAPGISKPTRRERVRISVRLNQRVVRRLEALGLVESIAAGRSRSLRLTTAGAHVASLVSNAEGVRD